MNPDFKQAAAGFPDPFRLLIRETAQSTNDELRTLAQSGVPGGLVLLALEQLAGRGRRDKLRALGYKVRGSLWELDHVVPLIDGGSHELSNLQTLCTPCHKKKTAEEARCRARRRQVEAEAAADDDLLAKADAALARSESLLAGLTPGAEV